MNIPEETPQGFTPSPLPAAARSSTRPSHLLCICHPKGQKNTKNLCLSPSPAADPLLLAACGAGDELPLEAPAAAAGPAPPPARPRAEPAGPLEKNHVKYFYLFIFSLLFIIPSWKMNFYFPDPLCPFPPSDFLINVSFGSCLCIPWFERR